MKGQRHTPDEIIRKLRAAESQVSAGKRIADVCTNLGVSENPFHSARLLRDPMGGRMQSRYSDRRAPVSPFLLVVTAFAIAFLPFEASAQAASAPMVRGIVREHETGGPVFDAIVTFTRQAVVIVESTESSGVFAARLPDPGAYEVAVRHAGFRPVTQLIDVTRGQEVVLEIRLSPVALEPIRVVSRRRSTRERIGGYHDRLDLYGELGIGRFVTREQIELDALVGSPVNFLRSLPFVTLGTFGGNPLIPVPYFRHHGQLCQPRLFYDGAPVDAEVLADVVGQRLEGIEVYRGHAQAPGTWSDPSGCGVILFWSRPDEEGNGVQWLRGRRGVLAIGLFLLGGYLVVR